MIVTRSRGVAGRFTSLTGLQGVAIPASVFKLQTEPGRSKSQLGKART